MRTLTSLCVLSFLVNLGYGIVLPVLPTLAHATPVDVGFMYSIFSAAKLVALLIGGAAADRVGAERVLRWGVVAYAVSLAGLGWADSVSSVLVFRAVEGLAVGVVVPAVSAIVLSTGDAPDFTRRHGIVLGVGGAGMVVGPLVGFAVGRESVRPAMLATAGVTLLAAWLVPKLAAHVRASSAGPVSLARELLGYARSGVFVILVLPLAFGKLAFGLLQPLLPLHAERIALTDLEVAALFGATGVLFALMQPVAGVVRRRFSARGMTAAFAALAALAFVAMAFWLGKLGFVGSYLAYVVFGSLLFAANSGLMGETYHEAQDDHGKVFGAMHAVTDLGMLVGPPLLLALYERDAALTFLALTSLGVVATGIFALGTRSRAPR
ncbi:MAG: MFS transporter [Sandaracinaceae bacterium]|nr:MFS transporter [Sandaracinaceae bacterium]